MCIARSDWEKNEPFEGFRSLEGRSELGEYLATLPQTMAYFVPRPDAEENDQHLQILPYIAIMCGDKILSYRRSPSGGEQRLHGKLSIGVGGHINNTDHKDQPFMAYQNGTKREMREEVGLDLSTEAIQRTVIGLLKDETNPVGRVHLGVAHVIEVTPLQADAILHNCEDTLNSPQFVSLVDFDNPEVFEELETWSQYFVQHLLVQYSQNGKWTDIGFRERVGLLALTASNLASAAMGFLMQEGPRAHLMSRAAVEEAAGALQCLLTGCAHNDDIDKDKMKTAAEEFHQNLPNILKHQKFNE